MKPDILDPHKFDRRNMDLVNNKKMILLQMNNKGADQPSTSTQSGQCLCNSLFEYYTVSHFSYAPLIKCKII